MRDRQINLRVNAAELKIISEIRRRVGASSDPEAVRYVLHLLGLELARGNFVTSQDALDSLARATAGLPVEKKG